MPNERGTVITRILRLIIAILHVVLPFLRNKKGADDSGDHP